MFCVEPTRSTHTHRMKRNPEKTARDRGSHVCLFRQNGPCSALAGLDQPLELQDGRIFTTVTSYRTRGSVRVLVCLDTDFDQFVSV